MGTSAAVSERGFNFHHWCIGGRGNVSLKEIVYVQQQSLEETSLMFKSLAETMEELGHSFIDLLKFDIEGFEWQLFDSELLSGAKLPEQLAFELHTQKANPMYVPPGNVADKGFVQVNRLFKDLYDEGYRVTSKELNSGDPACAEFVMIKVQEYI